MGTNEQMKRDYSELIAEFWPTIMRAWREYGNKRPVIECDVVRRQVLAWPAREYINELSSRTRGTTRRQYQRASAVGGIMIFIRDSKNRVLRSHVFLPEDAPEQKPKAVRRRRLRFPPPRR